MLLDRSTLFDVFRGGTIPEGHTSLAFALEFRAPDRTLTDEEVEPALVAIVDRSRAELGPSSDLSNAHPPSAVPLHSCTMRHYLSVDDLSTTELPDSSTSPAP